MLYPVRPTWIDGRISPNRAASQICSGIIAYDRKMTNTICQTPSAITSRVSTGNTMPTVGIEMKQNAAVKNRMP